MANPVSIVRALTILWPLIERYVIKRRKTMTAVGLIALAGSELFPEYDHVLKAVAGLCAACSAVPVKRKGKQNDEVAL